MLGCKIQDALHCFAGVAQESTLQQCSNAFPQKWRSAIRKELLAKTSWLVSAKQKRQHIHSSYPVPKQSSIIFLDPPALQPTYEVKKMGETATSWLATQMIILLHIITIYHPYHSSRYCWSSARSFPQRLHSRSLGSPAGSRNTHNPLWTSGYLQSSVKAAKQFRFRLSWEFDGDITNNMRL